VLVEGYFDFAQVFQATQRRLSPLRHRPDAQQAQLLARLHERSCSATIPTPPAQGAPPGPASCSSPKGFNVNVVALEKGEDPDTFVRQTGADGSTVKDYASRGRIWSTCSIRRARVNFGRTRAGNSFSRAC
jgi:hypothetical protein